MPNYDTHTKFGFTFSIIFSVFFVYLFSKNFKVPVNGWLLLLPFVVIVYSTIPDLDHPMSRLRRYVYYVLFVSMAGSYFLFGVLGHKLIFAITIVGFLGLLVVTMKHRGPFHSFTFVLLTAAPLLYLNWFLFVIAFVSGSSHLMIDRINSYWKHKILRKPYSKFS